MPSPDDQSHLHELQATLAAHETELDGLLRSGQVEQARVIYRLVLAYRDEVEHSRVPSCAP